MGKQLHKDISDMLIMLETKVNKMYKDNEINDEQTTILGDVLISAGKGYKGENTEDSTTKEIVKRCIEADIDRQVIGKITKLNSEEVNGIAQALPESSKRKMFDEHLEKVNSDEKLSYDERLLYSLLKLYSVGISPQKAAEWSGTYEDVALKAYEFFNKVKD